jgi:hypothetical protein
MLAIFRRFFFFLAFAPALEAASAGAGDKSLLGSFVGDQALAGFMCARPFAPPCVDLPDTYRNKESVAACQAELDRFAAATVAYRDCLERQISRDVRHANDVLDHFHCLAQRPSCPPTAKRP